MVCWHACRFNSIQIWHLIRGYTTCADAGYVYKWKGIPEGGYSSFPDVCLLPVNVSEVTPVASLRRLFLLINNEGKSLSDEAYKAELPAICPSC